MIISEEGQTKLKALRESNDFSRIDITTHFAYEWAIELTWSDLSSRRPDGVGYKAVALPDAANRKFLDDAIDAAYEYWQKNRKSGAGAAAPEQTAAEQSADDQPAADETGDAASTAEN